MDQQSDKIPTYKRPVLPDRELLLWEKWIQIRQDETTHLAKRLDRAPADLAMNLLTKVREDKERKIVLEHAQIEKKKGVRGSLWDRPPRLKQRCYCDPAYELHRTRAEKGRPPVIEHIGVPTYIEKNELGMAGDRRRNPCLQLNATYDQYREDREDTLKENIAKIDPWRPNIKALIIKGNRPPTPSPKMPLVPEIKVVAVKNNTVEPLSGVYAIKINNSIFYKEIPEKNLTSVPIFRETDSHENCTAWTYYFNVPIRRAGRSKLSLQNLGTVTIRYCWKRIKKIYPFIPDDVYERAFFFNKNEDVICPGQTKDIFFTFIADKPGIFNDYWEFSLSNINFFDTMGEKFVINLYGDAVEDIYTMKRKVEILKTRINRKAINNLASEFVEEILDKVFEVVPVIYPYKRFFLEAELFILRNPVCFYHQSEVNKMKELYTEMCPGELWDLSIGTWRQTMMEKEYEDRMKYYELLRKSHEQFLKPWYEGDDLIKDKYRKVQCLLGQFAEKFDKEFARVTDVFLEMSPVGKVKSNKSIIMDSLTARMVRHIFFLRMYEHLVDTIELCAGVLSSLDLNRWIEFDFCRHYD